MCGYQSSFDELWGLGPTSWDLFYEKIRKIDNFSTQIRFCTHKNQNLNTFVLKNELKRIKLSQNNSF